VASTFGPRAATFLAEPLGEELPALEASVASRGDFHRDLMVILMNLRVILDDLRTILGDLIVILDDLRMILGDLMVILYDFDEFEGDFG